MNSMDGKPELFAASASRALVRRDQVDSPPARDQ